MSMVRLRRECVGWLWALVVLVAPVVAQELTTIPYIHYFLPSAQGMVVERADGTDSRIYHFPVTTNYDSVQFLNWSPTGRWFTVINFKYHPMGGNGISQFWLVSTDGEERIDLGHHRRSQMSVMWSPVADVLLIVRTDFRDGSFHGQLFNTDTRTIEAETNFYRFGYDSPYPLKLSWTADGQTAFVAASDYLMILERGGKTMMHFNDLYDRNASGMPFAFHRQWLLHRVQIDTQTYESGIVVEDMASGQQRLISEADETWSSVGARLRVDPSLRYALVQGTLCEDTHCSSLLWRLEWESGEVMPIEPALPIPDLIEIGCESWHPCANVWSSAGNYATLTDDDDTLHVLTMATGEVQRIGTGLNYYEWTTGETLLYSVEGSLLAYDPATQTTTTIDTTRLIYPDRFVNSPDGRYIGILSTPATVIDRAGTPVVQIIQHSNSTGSYDTPHYGYTWNAVQTWVLVRYNIFFAGGGLGPESSVLASMDGRVRRELPMRGDAGFVPENAVAYLPRGQEVSPLPEPVLTIPTQTLVYALGWHPTDNNQLVMIDDGGLVFWSLDGETPSITARVKPIMPLPQDLGQGQVLHWLPEQQVVVIGNSTVSLDPATLGQTLDLPPSAPPETYARHEGATDMQAGLLAQGGMYYDTIMVIGAETGEVLESLHQTGYALALSTDGKRLASSAPGQVSIWNLGNLHLAR